MSTTVPLLFAVLAGLACLVLFATSYRRCPANHLLVVYGAGMRGGRDAIVTREGRFVLPLIQAHSLLSLAPIPVHDPASGKTLLTVRISGDLAVAQNAAVHLLGLSTEQIEEAVRKVLASAGGDVGAELERLGLEVVD